MVYNIIDKSSIHNGHEVEVRHVNIFQGLIRVYCLTCNQWAYVNPDSLIRNNTNDNANNNNNDNEE